MEVFLTAKLVQEAGPGFTVQVGESFFYHVFAVGVAAGLVPLSHVFLDPQLQRFLHHHAVAVVQVPPVFAGAQQVPERLRFHRLRHLSMEQQTFFLFGRYEPVQLNAEPLGQHQPIEGLALNHVTVGTAQVYLIRQCPHTDSF